MPVTVRVECDVDGCGRHLYVAQGELEYIDGLGDAIVLDPGDALRLGMGWRATGTQRASGSDFRVVCAEHAEEAVAREPEYSSWTPEGLAFV